MIKFNDVGYVAKDGKKEKVILKNINFTLPTKGMVALIGPSGSGKTTILNLICKTIDVSSGEIIYITKLYHKTSNLNMYNH